MSRGRLRAPRMTIYKREFYDCAECINLGSLLRGRYPVLDAAVDRTVGEILERWQLPDGHFRSRRLILDNMPCSGAASRRCPARSVYGWATSKTPRTPTERTPSCAASAGSLTSAAVRPSALPPSK